MPRREGEVFRLGTAIFKNSSKSSGDRRPRRVQKGNGKRGSYTQTRANASPAALRRAVCAARTPTPRPTAVHHRAQFIEIGLLSKRFIVIGRPIGRAIVVMAGLDPAIQAAPPGEESPCAGVSAKRSADRLDGRVKPGHDEGPG
jgi:hypothetical protein